VNSITAEKLRLDHEPVAILWSNEKPEGALQIKSQGVVCIMPLFAHVVKRGKTAVFDRESYGCPGARAGLGFDFMAAFFVKGAESSKDPEAYCARLQRIPERVRAKFVRGERLRKMSKRRISS
jgi:uncharacterized protein (DUF169 family)